MVCVSQHLFRQLPFWNFLLSPWLELGPSSLCQARPLNSWVGARPWVPPDPRTVPAPDAKCQRDERLPD